MDFHVLVHIQTQRRLLLSNDVIEQKASPALHKHGPGEKDWDFIFKILESSLKAEEM